MDDTEGLTTLYTPFWDYPNVATTTTRAPRGRSYDSPLDLSTYGVPLAFTAVVLVIMCMVIAYTKAQRRRARQRLGAQNNLRSISGGVPMNVAAYRNYGLHLASQTNSGDPLGSGGYYPDQPPPYEVAIQSPPPGQPQPYTPMGVPSVQPPQPPAYSESVPVSPPAAPGPPRPEGREVDPIQAAPQSQDRPHVFTGTSEDSDAKNRKQKDSEQLPEVDSGRVAPKPHPSGSGEGDCAVEMSPEGGEESVSQSDRTPTTDPTSNQSNC